RYRPKRQVSECIQVITDSDGQLVCPIRHGGLDERVLKITRNALECRGELKNTALGLIKRLPVRRSQSRKTGSPHPLSAFRRSSCSARATRPEMPGRRLAASEDHPAVIKIGSP